MILCFSSPTADINGAGQSVHILLSDFINLTQVHNFTVSAQDIFTFRRLLGIYRKFYENFASTYADNEIFCTVLLTSQGVMVQSLQPKGREFESTYFCFLYFFTSLFDSFNYIIIDVPRPLSNVFWIIIFKRLMRNAYTEPVCLEHLRTSK